MALVFMVLCTVEQLLLGFAVFILHPINHAGFDCYTLYLLLSSLLSCYLFWYDGHISIFHWYACVHVLVLRLCLVVSKLS